jgi:RNA polymerase-binding transcription factor
MDQARAQELLARERGRLEEELARLEPDVQDDEDTLEPADAGTDLLEAGIDEALAERLRGELTAVERAEERLAAGTYGFSVDSGEQIPDARLEAIPWAERTAEEQARYDVS